MGDAIKRVGYALWALDPDDIELFFVDDPDLHPWTQHLDEADIYGSLRAAEERAAEVGSYVRVRPIYARASA